MERLGVNVNQPNAFMATPLAGDADKSGITHTTEIECLKCGHRWEA